MDSDVESDRPYQMRDEPGEADEPIVRQAGHEQEREHDPVGRRDRRRDQRTRPCSWEGPDRHPDPGRNHDRRKVGDKADLAGVELSWIGEHNQAQN